MKKKNMNRLGAGLMALVAALALCPAALAAELDGSCAGDQHI